MDQLDLTEPTWMQRAARARLDSRDLIAGQRRNGEGAEYVKISPRDGEALYSVRGADQSVVNTAVGAARRAFDDGRWSRLSARDRKDVICRLARLVEENLEELALLECLDVGKPITDALTRDVPAAAGVLQFNAEACDKHHGSVYGSNASSLSFQHQQPYGVVAALVGWNFPLVLAAQKIGPALATGNSLVLKPSEMTSLSASRLAELALEAGVPPGVLNVVHGDGATGALLARHGDVDLLTFTGSTATGRKLMAASAESNMKRLILECGGKAANIVFADAPNLEAVADAVVARAFWNQGQVCTASSRLVVEEAIKDELLDLLIARVQKLIPGDPLDPSTNHGPLVGPVHADKVRAYIEAGRREGARLAHQSTSVPPGRSYVAPTIFDEVAPGHTIAQEEIFGPVLSVMSFIEEAEAVRIANGTIFGLSAIVWTTNLGRAHRVASQLQAGWILVNGTASPRGGLSPGALTCGGHKASGMGVEGGMKGLEEYLRQSTVQIFV